MQIWQELLKFSLIGTERQTVPLTATDDLQAYFQQLYPDNSLPNGIGREQALLTGASLVTQYQLAGQTAASFNGNLPAADTDDVLPVLSPLAITHLQRLLSDNQLSRVLPEWLTLAASKARRVPFTLIPELLHLATQHRHLRPYITSLIDQRGVWLAKQHPDWHKLLVQTDNVLADTQLWEEGSVAQREEFLRQYRQHDAAKARELLQAVWKQEAAATRQSLLAVLSHNLSQADEAFLNSCLEDRSKGVRQLAATLLGQLPDSAFSLRQKNRLNTWLRVEKTKSLFKKSIQLIVDLPEAWDQTWQADGIEEKPPQGKGQRAWWLEQALRVVPPAYWLAHWQLSTDELLTLLDKHEWRTPLLAGWQQALENYPDAAWAELFLTSDQWHQTTLWQSLNLEQTERIATGFLQELGSPALVILSHLQHTWTESFSKQVIAAIQRYSLEKSSTNTANLHYYITDVGYYLNPACSELWLSQLQTALQADDVLAKTLNTIAYTLSFRREMITTLSQQKDYP